MVVNSTTGHHLLQHMERGVQVYRTGVPAYDYNQPQKLCMSILGPNIANGEGWARAKHLAHNTLLMCRLDCMLGGGVRGEQTLQLTGQSNTGKTQVLSFCVPWTTCSECGTSPTWTNEWACLGADMFNCRS